VDSDCLFVDAKKGNAQNFVVARVGDKDCVVQFWRLRLSRVRTLCLVHRFFSIGAGYLIALAPTRKEDAASCYISTGAIKIKCEFGNYLA
jgi:hypothetical protein